LVTTQEAFIINVWGLLQHVSVQCDHVQVIHISYVTKKTQGYGCFICACEVSFVQIIVLY